MLKNFMMAAVELQNLRYEKNFYDASKIIVPQ